MLKRFLTTALLCLSLATLAAAQDVDNKGKEFVVAFAPNFTPNPNTVLFLTGDVATTALVEQPGAGFSQSFAVTPGMITSVTLPAGATHIANDTIEDKGVRITADEEIVVYGLNQQPVTTDAFLALPTEILGTDQGLQELQDHHPWNLSSEWGPLRNRW